MPHVGCSDAPASGDGGGRDEPVGIRGGDCFRLDFRGFHSGRWYGEETCKSNVGAEVPIHLKPNLFLMYRKLDDDLLGLTGGLGSHGFDREDGGSALMRTMTPATSL